MVPGRLAAVLFCAAMLVHSEAAAQDVRYYQEGGVTYREVRTTVQRPVIETRMEQHQQTVYRQQATTQTVPTTRTVYTPVTEYHWEARWHGLWNPFADPYVGYELVPATRWDTRTESVQQQVTRYNMVPQTETVQVPVTTQRMVNEEIISRMAVSAPPPAIGTATPLASGTAPVSVAQQQPIGGVSKLDSDPPRDGGWRSGQPSVSR